MIRLLYLLLSSFLILTVIAKGQQSKLLKVISKYPLNIAEPSDIIVASPSSFFVVSDNGYLAELDTNGNQLRKPAFRGVDFEAIVAVDSLLYIADESVRQIHILDKITLNHIRTIQLQYGGARNSGIESLTFNPVSKQFIAITEKDPTWIFFYDINWNYAGQKKLKLARDISSITYYKNNYWILSDEDMKVFKVNTQTWNIDEMYQLNILNPEGICFDQQGVLTVVSDDLKYLYKLKLP